MIKRRERDVVWRGRKRWKKVERERERSGRNEWWMKESSCWWGRSYQRGDDAPVVHCQSFIQPVTWGDVWKYASVCQTRWGSFIKRHVQWKILRGNWQETAFLPRVRGKPLLCMRGSGGGRKRGKWERSECVTAGQLYWAEEGVI